MHKLGVQCPGPPHCHAPLRKAVPKAQQQVTTGDDQMLSFVRVVLEVMNQDVSIG
jgi:hypothetical protein